jgi:hypothetical protein
LPEEKKKKHDSSAEYHLPLLAESGHKRIPLSLYLSALNLLLWNIHRFSIHSNDARVKKMEMYSFFAGRNRRRLQNIVTKLLLAL